MVKRVWMLTYNLHRVGGEGGLAGMIWKTQGLGMRPLEFWAQQYRLPKWWSDEVV